ncbi:MAG TPA: hypothetical protein VGH14_00285 [Solirubrobacterales bacterium]|jgi:hypothetical protein
MTTFAAHRHRGTRARRWFGVPSLPAIAPLLVMLALPSTALATGSPAIEAEAASNISSTDATLEAQIDPNGLETTYEVKLEAPACEGGACESTGGVEIAAGTIPAGSSAQPISVDVAQAWGHELTPKTRYGYSVNASNSAGETFGNFKVFETPGARPSIESESASNITATDATLEAQIDPNGLETTYEVNLEAPWCGSSGPGSCEGTGGVQIAAGTIPAGSSAQAISVDVAQAWGHELSPNTAYGYSVNASNSAGPVFGNLKDFETPAASPRSIAGESVSNVTATDATLEAEIEPQGASAGSYYQFQLVTDPGTYATEILCPPTLQPGYSGCVGPQGTALPIGWVPGNLENPLATQPVHLDLADAGVTLEPATTYHFRVLAARAVQTEDAIQWEEPCVFGADRAFTTLADPPPPSGSTGIVSSPGQVVTSTVPLHRKKRYRRKHRHRRGVHRPHHR